MHDILGWVALAAAIVAGLTAAWWALWVRPRPKRFCPGRRPGPWWLPWRLAWMPRCGYDLAAVGDGSVCPECGRAARAAKNLRRNGPVRPGGLILCMVLTAAACVGLRSSIRSGSYAGWMPTTGLILMERPGGSRDYRMQAELNRRVRDGMLNAWQTRWLCEAMADELHAPNQAWGPGLSPRSDCVRARRTLVAVWPRSREVIEELLGSPRWDVVCFATDTLHDHLGDEPTDLLLQAAVEQLRDDLNGGGRYYAPGNARRYAEYLLDHASAARPFLEQALASEDWQQRAVAAAILVTEQVGDRQAEAADVLVDSLARNDRGGDALLAAVALSRAGDGAIAPLERGVRGRDPQQAAWCRALLDARAGVAWTQIEPWLEPFRLTTRTRDPRGLTMRQAVSMLGW
ncbi:hypothetical protein VB671_17740 [Nodularia spumigena UHCC 0040]|nr:hypothetical protein [Nodularia spumigena UHCC 0040]